MSKQDDSGRFAENLRLAMERLNLSRVELAQLMAVDKSVARRWVLGSARPSDANLSTLTDHVAREVPAFKRNHWQADPAELARLLGLAPAAPAAGEMAGLLPHFAARALEGRVRGLDLYGGIWAQFYVPVAPPGPRLLFCGGVRIDTVDGQLWYHVSDGARGVWTGGGPAFCVDGRLWTLIEEHRGRSDLCAIVYTGVTGHPAAIVDGMALARAANAGGVPVAGRFTLVRLSALPADREVADNLYHAVCARAGDLSLNGLAEHLPAEVTAVLTGESGALPPRHQPFVMTLPEAANLTTNDLDVDLLPFGEGGATRRHLVDAVRVLFAEALASGG